MPDRPVLPPRTALTEAVRLVPGARMACLRMRYVCGDVLQCTEERAARMEECQLDHGHGPSIEAVRTRRIVLADVGEIRTHWTAFARSAREANVFSFLVVPLCQYDELVGTLSFYGSRSHAFDNDAEVVAASAARAVILGLRAERAGYDGHETAS